MSSNQDNFVNVSPVRISKAHSKLKKRLFYGLLIGAGLHIYSNYYKTELIFHYCPTQFNKNVIQGCYELRRGIYKPTWWLPNAFLMAVYGAKFDPVPYVPFVREQVKMSDKGSVYIDWGPVYSSVDNEECKILVILHGLTGASETNYIRQAVLNGRSNGFRTVVFNMRGMGDCPLDSPKYMNFSDTSDLKETIKYLQSKYPKASMYALGISMGANMAIKYAGEEKDKCPFKAIVSIANPYDIHECAIHMSKLSNFIYDWNLLRGFKRLLVKNRNQIENHPEIKFDVDEILATNSTKDFDGKFMSKLHGFKTVEEFYKSVGCINYLKDVTVPTLFINSRNDPVIPSEIIPREEIKKKDNMILVETQKGSHIDWMTHYSPKRWVYWPSMEYLLYIDDYLKKNGKI